MNIDHLIAQGFRSRTIENWKRLGIGGLLPLQQRALTHTRLLTGHNVVVFSPTSSGKTFVAELAALRHFEQGRKSIFLVPTKALAEEQFAYLTRCYSPLGARVVIATRDRTTNDDAILRGDFDFAVMVYEKLKAFLTLAPELVSRIALVIVDELQILGEPERGDGVDLLLTNLLAADAPVQLLCLSAVLAENTRLAAWLRADCLVWRERPIELREGVFRISDGCFQYRESNSGADGTEDLLGPESGMPNGWAVLPDARHYHYPAISTLAGAFARKGEQTLIFVPTRRLALEWAYRLATDLQLPEIENSAELLSDVEESHARVHLQHCLAAGVAFHNSDLGPELRALVEQQFATGAARVLVATSTLAQGVNIKCRNVISVPVMLQYDSGTGRAIAAPLTRQRFRNQGGRAGRLATGEAYGRSILVAEDDVDAERMMREFVVGEVEPLEPAIREDALQRLALDLVHTGRARTRDALLEVLQETYTAQILWNAQPADFERAVDSALARLAAADLLGRAAGGRLQPTGVGQIAAAYGLTPDTMALFIGWCRARRQQPPSMIEVLSLCAFSADGETFPLPPTHHELAMQVYPQLLSLHDDLQVENMADPVRALLQPCGGFSAEGHHALKKIFLCEAWLSTEPTAQVEERFRTFSGAIVNLATHLAWLAQGLSACMATLGTVDHAKAIQRIAERLPQGIAESGRKLARLYVSGLTRNFVAMLVRDGYDSPEALRTLSVSELRSLLPHDLAMRVLDACHRERERQGKSLQSVFFAPLHAKAPAGYAATGPGELPQVAESETAIEQNAMKTNTPGPHDPMLIVDAKRPGEIQFCGRRIELTPKPYLLARCLAENPNRIVTYQEIDEVLWPDSRVEPQQRNAHKQVLLKQLASVCGSQEAQRLLTIKPRFGIKLNLPAEQVRVTV